METTDLAEAVATVGHLYCPHELRISGAETALWSSMEVLVGGAQPVVDLRYSAPVRIDAGLFEDLLLIKTCTAGAGCVQQGASPASLKRGQTIPLSPGVRTQLEFHGGFSQRSVRVDVDTIERLCATYLNRPLDTRLRFEPRPFSPALEQVWGDSVELVISLQRSGLEVPPASAVRLNEFMLSLLLELHPHNHSAAMQAPERPAPPRAVREAEYLMQTAPAREPLTVPMIARAVGISVRSLEAGFQAWRGVTPTQYYRSIRLGSARAELVRGGSGKSVSMIALEHGFAHLSRFSAYYRAAYGESPVQTLRRGKHKTD